MATIVVHTQGAVVGCRSQHLTLMTPDGVRRDIPLLSVDRVYCYGKIQVTTHAIHLLAGAGKDLVFCKTRTGIDSFGWIQPRRFCATRRPCSNAYAHFTRCLKRQPHRVMHLGVFQTRVRLSETVAKAFDAIAVLWASSCRVHRSPRVPKSVTLPLAGLKHARI